MSFNKEYRIDRVTPETILRLLDTVKITQPAPTVKKMERVKGSNRDLGVRVTPGKKQLTLTLNIETVEKIRKMAKERGSTVSDLCLKLMRDGASYNKLRREGKIKP